MSTQDATLEREHLLSTLEPEEREAMLLEVDDNKTDMRAGPAEEDEDDGDGFAEGPPPVEGKPAETPPAAEVTPPAGAAPAAAAVVETPTDEPEALPTGYVAKLHDDFKAQVEQLTTESEDLAAKFKAGDIEFDEYRTASADLNARRHELDRLQVKAEISEEMAQQNAAREWQTAIATTFKAAKGAGIDYEADTGKRSDLDTFVKALAAKDENADKSMRWFLDEGHKRVLALHGIAAATPAAGDPTPKPTPTSRKPPLDAVPQTLAQVPGSDGPGDIAGEFSDVDRLGGDALEDAIRRMSPADRERYFAGR